MKGFLVLFLFVCFFKPRQSGKSNVEEWDWKIYHASHIFDTEAQGRKWISVSDYPSVSTRTVYWAIVFNCKERELVNKTGLVSWHRGDKHLEHVKTCYHSDIQHILLAFILWFASRLNFPLLRRDPGDIIGLFFSAPQAWWGLHKISCLTGGTCPGATQRTLFQKSPDTLSLSLPPHPHPLTPPPMSPSHNTGSDIESRGLLFKIAAHRHSSEDLNNQL